MTTETSERFLDNEEVIKHGFLDKRGQSLMASWQTRWFILTSQTLSYYTDHKLSQQKGILYLNYSYLVTRKPSEGQHKYLLNLYDKQNGRNLLLCASDLITLTSWENAISDVIQHLKIEYQQLQQEQQQMNTLLMTQTHNENDQKIVKIDEIIYEDFLYKDGGSNAANVVSIHTWTKRWCVLTKNTLSYFTDQKKLNMKGVFVLNGNSFILRRKSLNSDKQYVLGLYLDSLPSGGSGGAGGGSGGGNYTSSNPPNDRSQRLLCASSEELLTVWYNHINDAITRLKHTNNLIAIRVFICNEYNTPFLVDTTETIFRVCTFLHNQIVKIEYHHYADLRLLYKQLIPYVKAINGEKNFFENVFPRQYKRNSFGVQLTDDELEKRRLQLELWLQELFDKYNEFLVLNDLNLLRRITGIFGYTPLGFNDLLNSVKNGDSDDDDFEEDEEGAVGSTKKTIPRLLLLSDSLPRRESVIDISDDNTASTEMIAMPEKASELKSFPLLKLSKLCLLKHVDCKGFTSRKHYIKALSNTYTPTLPYLHGKHVRLYLQKLFPTATLTTSVGVSLNIPKIDSPLLMNEIDNIFVDYCKRFDMIPETRIKLLLVEYSLDEKIEIILKCISIWDKDVRFTGEDMMLLEHFQSPFHSFASPSSSLDVFFLLTITYRINSSTVANNWLERFCSYGGLFILIQKMTKLLEFKPLLSSSAISIYLLLQISRQIIQSDCRYLLVSNSSFIPILFQILFHSSSPSPSSCDLYYDLIYELFELFSEILIYGGNVAYQQILYNLKYYSSLFSQKPFQKILDIYSMSDVMIQSSVISFINSLLIYCSSSQEKISLRNYLFDLHFEQLLVKSSKEYAKFIGNPIVSNQESQHDNSADVAVHSSPDNEEYEEIQFTYSKQLRSGIAICDQECEENFAEDDTTLINPELGHMEGCGLEILVNIHQIDETDIVGGVPPMPPQTVVGEAVGSISNFFTERLSFRSRTSSSQSIPSQTSSSPSYGTGSGNAAPTAPPVHVKRYWYRLTGHHLCWYNEITGAKITPATQPLGSIDFRTVIAVLDYSLLPSHVNLCFQHCFTIISLAPINHRPTSSPLLPPPPQVLNSSSSNLYSYYHMCVDTLSIKHQWLYSFAMLRNYLQHKRSPILLPNPHPVHFPNQTISTSAIFLLKKNFENLVNIYRSVTKEDINSLYLNEIPEFMETSLEEMKSAGGNPGLPRISFGLTDFIQFLHYELRSHRNEDKFIILMKELGDYVIKNYAPKPIVLEDDDPDGRNYPAAVISSERPIPRAPPLPPLPPNKPIIKPNTKVKQLFWTVIKPVNIYNTIWMGLEESQKIPWEKFDQLFTASQPKKKLLSSSSASENSSSKKSKQKQAVALFDARRTQNVAIACGKLRKSPEEIYDLVVMLDPDELNVEMNDTILNLLLPTSEETNLVKNYLITNMKLYENAKFAAGKTMTSGTSHQENPSLSEVKTNGIEDLEKLETQPLASSENSSKLSQDEAQPSEDGAISSAIAVSPSEGDAKPPEGDINTPESDANPSDGHAAPSESDVSPAEGDVNPEGDAQPLEIKASQIDATLSEGDITPPESDVNPAECDAKLSEIEVNPSKIDATPSESDVKSSEDDSEFVEGANKPLESDLKLVPSLENEKEQNGWSLTELDLINDLDYSGKLFAYFMNIDRLESRLKCHKIILTWNDEANVVYEQLNLVQEAIQELNSFPTMNSLKLILSTLLTIGNYMNGLTKRGQAHGYHLDILLKLKLIKQSESNRKHLLHYLIQYLQEFYQEDTQGSENITSPIGTNGKGYLFYSEWKAVWLTNKINLNNLEILFKEIRGSIEICRQEIVQAEEITNDLIRRPLVEKLGQFITQSTERYHQLTEQFEDTCRAVSALKKYFGETNLGISSNPEDDPWQTFFVFLIKFAEMFKIAVQEIEEWKQQERRMKNKLTMTVAGKMTLSSVKKPSLADDLKKRFEEKAAAAAAAVEEGVREKLKARQSLRINSQNLLQTPQGVGAAEGTGDAMKSFKDQIQALRKNRKEINRKPLAEDKESDEEGDEDGEEEEW